MRAVDAYAALHFCHWNRRPWINGSGGRFRGLQPRPQCWHCWVVLARRACSALAQGVGLPLASDSLSTSCSKQPSTSGLAQDAPCCPLPVCHVLCPQLLGIGAAGGLFTIYEDEVEAARAENCPWTQFGWFLGLSCPLGLRMHESQLAYLDARREFLALERSAMAAADVDAP